MNRVKVYCMDCDKMYVMKFEEASELYQQKCKKCGGDNIFYNEFIYEKEPDRTPLKLGDRGCGTEGRFK